jgi:4-diphosphocytidyl-2-C-methyl-D-erythritol kinase
MSACHCLRQCLELPASLDGNVQVLTELRDCPAPAKLNLFLHVVGRRADGYHLIESAFVLIDLADTLHFKRREDGLVQRGTILEGVSQDSDLSVRAARLLQAETGCRFGVDIAIEKRIPMGGGLGGGSSDAATTLLALNRLWQLGLSRAELMRIGLQLGADVPFFVFGQNALVQGIGEQFHALEISPRCFVIIHPGVAVPTAAIFTAPELTRDTESLRISDFSANPQENFGSFRNDLEPVAVARFPAVGKALDWLGKFGMAGTPTGARASALRNESRMSGSGACVFLQVTDGVAGNRILRQGLPAEWAGWVCQSLPEHPLRSFGSN